MLSIPVIASALVHPCDSPEGFSERSINALFRTCTVRAGFEWESSKGFELIERLWENDSVMSTIEALQESHEANVETALNRRPRYDGATSATIQR
jgi:hypothetical protein